MWLSDHSRMSRGPDMEESDLDSTCSSGEEIPIWVRGEQRWVSGITEETTCLDVVDVLCKDEEKRGRHMGFSDQYQITERWRGVEQSLEPYSKILDIWNTWGSAQKEVKISLRRVKSERSSNRRTKCRSDASIQSDRSIWKTVHPKRFQVLNDKGLGSSSTDELLKLVLVQGEVIRKQLKKLRHSEHQIGYLEDKTHRARVRKHGSNYLLETYLKGLSEAVQPDNCGLDKNSDSGVMTEGDSEQSNLKDNNKNVETTSDRFSQSSEELFNQNIKDDDTSSTVSESTLKEQSDLLEKIIKLNKNLLKQEEALTKLNSDMKKYDRNREGFVCNEELSKLRKEMVKSSCEMQHNEVVLEETLEVLEKRRKDLEFLHRALTSEDQEYEMLQALLYTGGRRFKEIGGGYKNIYHRTKEMLDTLV